MLGQFPGRLDRFTAATREEDPIEVAGRITGYPLGQFDGTWVGIGPDRMEREGARLLHGGFGQLGSAVSELVDEQAGQTVEVAAPLGVPDVGTLTADDDRDLARRIGGMAREVHPEVIATGRLQSGVLIGAHRLNRRVLLGRSWHGTTSSGSDLATNHPAWLPEG